MEANTSEKRTKVSEAYPYTKPERDGKHTAADKLQRLRRCRSTAHRSAEADAGRPWDDTSRRKSMP